MTNRILMLSIIICTYNRSELLENCLISLTKQSVDSKNFEVLIIDNNSTDETQKIAMKFVEKNKNFRYFFEEKQGLSNARNRGWQEAFFDYVAYVDDDGFVEENYVEEILFTIKNYDFDCFGGKVVNWFKFKKPKWFPEIYDLEKEQYNEIVEYNGFISGGIIVFKKSVLEKFGGFNLNLGMKKNKIAVGEEILLQVLIREFDGKIGFNPKIILHHLVAEEKMTVYYQLKRAFISGKDSDFIFKTKSSVKFYKLIMFFLINWIIPLKNFLFKREYFWQNFILDSFKSPVYILGQYLNGKKGKK